jgi:mono/diheme cytochrome c family protein
MGEDQKTLRGKVRLQNAQTIQQDKGLAAPCHGETGAGDGVFADDVAAAGESSGQAMDSSGAMTVQTPASFADPKRILGASPALLQGKILRGGMGTGMPMWGSIFTEEQIWDLVAYIYSFHFLCH